MMGGPSPGDQTSRPPPGEFAVPPPYCYDYPRPSVTVDLTVFALTAEGLRALFIKRKKDPFADHWAIPGGFLDLDEPIEAAARRELKEETGLEAPSLVEPIGVFGALGRDPRGRTISIAHAAVIRPPLPPVRGSDDAREAAWLDPEAVSGLAFDHDQILALALEWLRVGVLDGEFGPAMLPPEFGSDDVRRLLSAVSGSGRGAGRWLRDRVGRGTIAAVAGSEPTRFAVPASSSPGRPR